MSDLCAMERDFLQGSKFFRKAFPPTDFVCNSKGELIHFDGAYDVEKHMLAYERAKKWMLVDGEWIAKPGMVPFRRLFKNQINPADYQVFKPLPRKFNFVLTGHSPTEGWSNGLPPICIGMLGRYKRRKAVVVGWFEREDVQEKVIGIGDPECLFKDYESENRVKHFGKKQVRTKRSFWRLMTASGDVELPTTSSTFHRSNQIVKNFDNRGVIRALKYIVDPITVAMECSFIPDRLEEKRPQDSIPRKKNPITVVISIPDRLQKRPLASLEKSTSKKARMV